MKKLIVFEEKEFNEKLVEFSKNFMGQAKEGYGVSLISNETGDLLDMCDHELVCGSLYMAWNKTFKDTSQ